MAFLGRSKFLYFLHLKQRSMLVELLLEMPAEVVSAFICCLRWIVEDFLCSNLPEFLKSSIIHRVVLSLVHPGHLPVIVDICMPDAGLWPPISFIDGRALSIVWICRAPRALIIVIGAIIGPPWTRIFEFWRPSLLLPLTWLPIALLVMIPISAAVPVLLRHIALWRLPWMLLLELWHLVIVVVITH